MLMVNMHISSKTDMLGDSRSASFASGADKMFFIAQCNQRKIKKDFSTCFVP